MLDRKNLSDTYNDHIPSTSKVITKARTFYNETYANRKPVFKKHGKSDLESVVRNQQLEFSRTQTATDASESVQTG